MKSLVSWLLLIAGVLGVGLCVAGLVGVRTCQQQTQQRVVAICAGFDDAFGYVDEKLQGTQQRVRGVTGLTNDFRSSLQDWAKSKSADHIQIGQKAEVIQTHLQHAGDGLDVALAFLKRVRDALQLVHPFRAHHPTQHLDSVVDDLADLRSRVTQAVVTVNDIKTQSERADSGTLARRAVAALVPVTGLVESTESTLQDISERVTAAQTQVDQFRQEVLDWLRYGSLAAYAVLVWMAIGQVALCISAWRSVRGPALSAAADGAEAEQP